MSRHPDVPAEQAHLDWAHDCVKQMRGRTEHALLNAESAATEVDSEVAVWHLQRRLGSLDEDGPTLCFGRIDTDEADRWYIGRRHVEDPAGDPVVVDWRARVSVPFYRATVQDPQGLERRRRFSLEGRALIDIAEEDFGDPEGATVAGGIPDPLLAELERERTGQMRDIVATIAAEQDMVIRAPLDRLLVVQGGPGTGKTAVALHRAAFLLYEHRDRLDLDRVLVIGPNQTFLRYISGVLPSLGETAVVQTTIEGLAGSRYHLGPTEADPAVASLKGDGRMVEVIHRLIADRRRLPDEESVLPTAWGTVRLPPDAVAGIAREIIDRDVPHAVGRESFRNQLLHLAYERHETRAEVPALKARFVADTRNDAAFTKLADRWWPALSPATVVRQLLGSKAALRRVADGILTAEERDRLHRSTTRRIGDERWSPAELALLDEAEARITGPRTTYGHVIVDEAQDLSTMALRMAGRRAARGSMTVVGDLAQATTPWAQRDWSEVAATLTGGVTPEVTELSVGYRVPAAVLDLANRLLELAAPGVTPARSVRDGGGPPRLVPAGPASLTAATIAEARSLTDRYGSVALIATASRHERVGTALDTAGFRWSSADRAGRGEQVTLLTPSDAKGLEFDAVCVVEPADLTDDGPVGVRMLFVALTRAVQHLSIVHERRLPEPLR